MKEVEMTVRPPPPPIAVTKLEHLKEVLSEIMPRVVACSGGIDSLLLATVAYRAEPEQTRVAHAVSPAVPAEATRRVKDQAEQEGWNLNLVESGEFADEHYLENPANRCYYCKSQLYATLARLAQAQRQQSDDAIILSGANLDDLGEYRPGLIAASENGVRHPFIEASFSKQDIRAVAHYLGLQFADLPASPCLASRLYTGTRVTAARLAAVEAGETLIRDSASIDVVRCRIQEDSVLIEVPDAQRGEISEALIARVAAAMKRLEPGIAQVALDPQAYRSGRAFLVPD